jgi:hypothetical protein
LWGAGAGGSRRCSGLRAIVSPDQRMSVATMTVVTYMIRSASFDDSCRPSVFRHQK